MQKYFFLGLLFIGACSTSTEQEQPDKKLAVKVSPQLTPSAPRAEDVLFANLISVGGRWQIQSIGSQRKPVDLLKGEERLYVLTNSKTVMPDYAHYRFRDEEKRLFDCSQAVKYNRHTSYNPCTSQFTHNTKFGEGWFGWAKLLDTKALHEAIIQSDLIARADDEIKLVRADRLRCRELKKQADQLAESEKLQLRVIDDTGMYKEGHKLIQYDLNIKPEVTAEGCTQQLEDVKLSYDVGIKQNIDLVLELRGKSDWKQVGENRLTLERAIADTDKPLLPTLFITGKKIQRYNLYQSWSNQDIEILWNTVDITHTDLLQRFELRNLAQQEVRIESISFYINKHVITKRNQYVLAAQAKESDLEHASRYFLLGKKRRENVEAIKTIESENEQAEFGVRVVYMLGNKKRTLRMSEKLQLTSIL